MISVASFKPDNGKLRHHSGPDEGDTDDDSDGYLDEGSGEAAECGPAGNLCGLIPVAAFDDAFAEQGEETSADTGTGDGANEGYWNKNCAAYGTDHGTDNGENPGFFAATGFSGADGGGEEFGDFTKDGNDHEGDKGNWMKDGVGWIQQFERDGDGQHEPDPGKGEKCQHHAGSHGGEHDQDY